MKLNFQVTFTQAQCKLNNSRKHCKIGDLPNALGTPYQRNYQYIHTHTRVGHRCGLSVWAHLNKQQSALDLIRAHLPFLLSPTQLTFGSCEKEELKLK